MQPCILENSLGSTEQWRASARPLHIWRPARAPAFSRKKQPGSFQHEMLDSEVTWGSAQLNIDTLAIQAIHEKWDEKWMLVN